jgi:hypothetical protein
VFSEYLTGLGVVGAWMRPSASDMLTDVVKLHPKWLLLDLGLVVGRNKVTMTNILVQGFRVRCMLEDQAV